jgi:hypothetical protein
VKRERRESKENKSGKRLMVQPSSEEDICSTYDVERD